jgi:hypothetical protein
MTKTKIWKAYPIFKHAQQGLSQKIYKSSHPRRNGDNNNNNHNNRAWPCWGARFEQKKNNDHKKSLAYRTVHEMQKR